MKIKTYFSNIYVRGILLVLAGLFMGWLIFHQSREEKINQVQEATESKNTIWTCAMHPQIRLDHPGKCPICGMELIPLEQNASEINPEAVTMTEEAIKLAEVQTSIVAFQKPVKELRLYGKIQADERRVQTQPTHVPGRIEKLILNFTGEEVRKGQPIAEIYSPEIINAQQELLEALKMKELQPQILEAAREKLRQWKFTSEQISLIEKNEAVKNVFVINANVSGIVINKRVNIGDYVSQGTPLYEIADLSHVWAMFDAYESDLPWIRKGDKISFTLNSQPEKEFSGNVSFIDPVIDPLTRVAKVRVEISNPGNFLKPEMFITGVTESHLQTSRKLLVIPQSAVLWTGTRSVVYIKIPDAEEPSFMMREITLGTELNNSYVVLKGLNEGDEIVTNGTFSVDASAQLLGKQSMMNPEGGNVSNGMAGMDMGESKNENSIPENSLHKDHLNDQTMKMDMTIDDAFKEQVTLVYDKYLEIKDALFASDYNKAKTSSGLMLAQLEKVDMTLLNGERHIHWMNLLGNLNDKLNEVGESRSLDSMRISFSVLSSQLAEAIKIFGLKDQTSYYQFCPMANNNEGAYWLSQFKEIKNPYMGAKMPTCGDTKEILK